MIKIGKDLKGKELGVGLSQLKNKKYRARFVATNGQRRELCFEKLAEAKKWLAQAKYEDQHSQLKASSRMTVNTWFEFWIEEIKGNTVRRNTKRNYSERYMHNIKDELGDMIISEVKPMHCQRVLNLMEEEYKGSTMEQCRITMYNIFADALENKIILTNPVTKSVKCPKKVESKIRFLTKEEHIKFLEVAKNSSNYYQYALILQTGLRAGELTGLKWSDIDFEKRTLSVNRSMEFRYSEQKFLTGEPKSKSGYRTIPLTQEAYNILKAKEQERSLEKVRDIRFKDIVFINRKGTPTKNSAYDSTLYKLAKKAGIEKLSMHSLRHTFATRAIEAGMRPKTLQKLLGHSNIGITMNLYVHVSEDEKEKEMQKLEKAFMVV